MIPLAILSGIGNGLTRLNSSQAGETIPVTGLVVGGIIGGAIGGVIGIYLMGLMVRWTGSWLGGTANSEEVRAALSWGAVPVVALLPIELLAMAILGEDYFRIGGPANLNIQNGVVLMALGVAMLVLGLWSGFLNIKCVAEVHRFSAWRGLGAILLVALLAFGIVLIMALVFGLGTVLKAGG